MKYDIVVGEENKHMVEYKHFNQERAVQYAEQYMSFGTRRINNTLTTLKSWIHYCEVSNTEIDFPWIFIMLCLLLISPNFLK